MNDRYNNLPTFYSSNAVAKWLGVSRDMIQNWVKRFDNVPAPVGRVKGLERYSLFWSIDQKQEWVDWMRDYYSW